MRVERVKNFLNLQECEALNSWADLGVSNKWLDAGISAQAPVYHKRVTTRLYAERFEYPQLVRDISERIRDFCGVSTYPIISGHGRDGVVVSCTFPGGDVYPHRDPRSSVGMATLRCNVMTRAADSGCLLHVEDEVLDIEVGELHCYLVSEHLHFATAVEGCTSRVMWMFGAHVPPEHWDEGIIKLNQQRELTDEVDRLE